MKDLFLDLKDFPGAARPRFSARALSATQIHNHEVLENHEVLLFEIINHSSALKKNRAPRGLACQPLCERIVSWLCAACFARLKNDVFAIFCPSFIMSKEIPVPASLIIDSRPP
jgi:hypothetical protein